MKLYKKIADHLALLREMEKAGLSDEFLKKYKEEELFSLSQSINQLDAKKEIAGMETKTVEYLIHDQGFLSLLVRLLREDICDTGRISRLLVDAGDDFLSKRYSYEEIVSVLADEQVESHRAYVYLKYFVSKSLRGEEKRDLMGGLDALDQCEAFSIEDLSDTERGLLMEPAVSGSFLWHRLKEREFWKKLENPPYLTLLNELSFLCTGVYLGEEQAGELWQHTAEIQEGLTVVVQRLPVGEMERFLSLWLENKALVYDLNRLKRILPDKIYETVQEEADTQSTAEGSSGRKVRFTQNRITYLNFLYGDLLHGVHLEYLSERQKNLLIYAITHKKKHFLTMVKEHFDDFTYLGRYALLLDADIYERYLNVNSLNPKNLKESGHLTLIADESKQYMNREQYTFEELKLFSMAESQYVRLYHLLSYPKSDDRLRVIREVKGRDCLLKEEMETARYMKLGEMLSKKPVSKWLSVEMGHIKQISYRQAVLLLSVWDQVERFIPDLHTGHQAGFLLKNLKAAEDFSDFQEFADQMLETDYTWRELNAVLKIGESFLCKHREGVKNFLYEGGAEIFYAFLSKTEEADREKARRLCTAEMAGKFLEVKYYKNDLKREIALRLSEETQQSWMKNMQVKRGRIRLWEEDRLLPVMQIGESLGHTCLSYRDGMYKKCFDANKKVLYASFDGQLVFRAILRLTKGSFSEMRGEKQNLQFADIMEEETADKTEQNQREHLTLFLERPYFKGISKEKEKEVVFQAVEMLLKKAKQLQAELVLSNSYHQSGVEEKKFLRAKYYMYISASKNGKQYLDSLGGMAEISSEGSYKEGYFFLRESFLNPKTSKEDDVI